MIHVVLLAKEPTDQSCESLESTKSTFAFNIFERVFKDYGLPSVRVTRCGRICIG